MIVLSTLAVEYDSAQRNDVWAAIGAATKSADCDN
jgi:hypothetical protein